MSIVQLLIGALEKEQTWTDTLGETWSCKQMRICPMKLFHTYVRNTFVTLWNRTGFRSNAHLSLARRVAVGSWLGKVDRTQRIATNPR